jgi:tRNA-specific 2-thiouridylase
VKVAVAMSGGVDSSVAAALLKKEGHDVIGLTMQLRDENERELKQSKTVAEKLEISHFTADLRDDFTDMIINDFCREYRQGRTPNPCIRCNKYIKFGALMDRALELGADHLATGHYARVARDGTTGKLRLKKGADRQKDQSYFLCRLDQEQLSRTLFPIGNLTKQDVRKIASDMDLTVRDRPESQEICFIPDNDYGRFLEEHDPEFAGPGPILDTEGHTVGEHTGLHRYTIGQRRGLGVAAAEPLYVTAIEPERNAVIIGNKETVYDDELTASDVHWVAGTPPEYPVRLRARIRYRHTEAEAVITPEDRSSVYVKFTKPQMAITPGQTVVFYDGENVIGCGTINKQGNKK